MTERASPQQRRLNLFVAATVALWLRAASALAQPALPVGPPLPAGPKPETVQYTVQQGDTCMKIVRRVYQDPRYLDFFHSANLDLGPSPHSLVPGSILSIPLKPAVPPKAPDARLTWLRNQVESWTPDRHPGKRNEDLMRGHRVSTRDASSAEVTFHDESRMQLGEHTLVVILGDSGSASTTKAGATDTTLMSGSLRAHLSELAGTRPKPVAVATPAGRVMVEPGEAQLSVDQKRSTRLAVYRGRSRLKAQGKEVSVKEGFGSRADEGQAPTPPRPLPAPPLWTRPLPSLLLLTNAPAAGASPVRGEYGPGAAPTGLARGQVVPAPAGWHAQLAKDARFNDLIVDRKLPLDENSLDLKEVVEGSYFARASAIDDDHFEGKFGEVARVRVVAGKAVPPAAPDQQGRLEVPDGIYCGIDGGALALTAGGAGVALPPGKNHRVRCAADATGAGASEAAVAMPAGPGVTVVEEVRAVRFESGVAVQDVLFRLTDRNGDPLSGARCVASASGGASASPVVAGPDPGSYLTTVRWTPAPGAAPVKVQLAVDDGRSGPGAREVVLPAVAPPVAGTVTPSPTTPAAPSAAAGPTRPRVGFEGGLMATLRVDDGFHSGLLAAGFGAEVGLRIRVGQGAIAAALRGTYDRYSDTANHEVHSLALPIAWRIRDNANTFIPYVAFVPQLMWEHTLARGAARHLKFVYGGLAGLQINVGPGGFFLEVGYEHRDSPNPVAGDLPPGGLFGGLGYRFRFEK